jgi:hypothetical protein
MAEKTLKMLAADWASCTNCAAVTLLKFCKFVKALNKLPIADVAQFWMFVPVDR